MNTTALALHWKYCNTHKKYCLALHCTTLHCTTMHCIALHCTAQHFSALNAITFVTIFVLAPAPLWMWPCLILQLATTYVFPCVHFVTMTPFVQYPLNYESYIVQYYFWLFRMMSYLQPCRHTSSPNLQLGEKIILLRKRL